MVPMFQRRYVWNEELQWEPLWEDVVRIADRLLAKPNDKPQPHFLGAVVLQQPQTAIGRLQQWTIIDGQQRLTTLQLLLDALRGELLRVQAASSASRIQDLVANPEHYCLKPEDRFKVWPTNNDRLGFNAVMAATPPIDYEALGHRGELMVNAHRFFAEQARKWLSAGSVDVVGVRGDAIDMAVRNLVQMVVIELGVDENPQEIFETLNHRGAPLSSADLIKNLVFQRLSESGVTVEDAYNRDWAEFDSGFWEVEASTGRIRAPRSAIFFNHWLVARTGEEIVANAVFKRFKQFALDAGPMVALLPRIQKAAVVYRQFVTMASTPGAALDRLALFGYRTTVLESEVVKPLMLFLRDPDEPPIPQDQLNKVLDAVESWMVRRMLVRATTKNYNQAFANLIAQLRKSSRTQAGDEVESWLKGQGGISRYWPDDDEIRTEMRELLAYRRLGRGRLRMVLEAIEDHKRGFKGGEDGLGGERVPRGTFTIEHVMPRKWATHWPPSDGFRDETDRDRLIHTLGNLTLLTSRINPKVSNSAWLGAAGKRATLQKHDVLMLNRQLIPNRQLGDVVWTDDAIRARTAELVELIIEIWPVPKGHHSGLAEPKPKGQRKVQLSELIGAGRLEAGMLLFPRVKAFSARVARLRADGQIEVDGMVYSTPREAATAIAGKPKNGMWFFLVSQEPKRSLATVKREYVAGLAVDTSEDDTDDEDDEEV
jgi:hypothetical protein